MKKLLMLGGSHFQVPAIKYAKEAGYYVITADYLPKNPGHKYSDEYHNVSTTDNIQVLKLAESLKIDGILSYASDPGAPTAAYVAEKLSLPGNPYESVRILQRKDLFRQFLKTNGLMAPVSEDFNNLNEARVFAIERLKYNPIVIKPADSSGSKGVSKLDIIDNFKYAFELALKYTMVKLIVIEDFIEKATYEMDGDGFVWDGKLVFRCFGNQHNDIECNPYVPMGISFPYIQEKDLQEKAHKIIEDILSSLNMKVGGLNIEYLTDRIGNIYILEIGPRNGGNLIPEVIKYSTGVDLIAYAVESSLGKDCSDLKMIQPNGFFASYILHAQEDGIIKEICIADEIKPLIVKQNILVKIGDNVQKFNGSNNTLGTFILKFNSENEMLQLMDNMPAYIKLEIKH